MTPTTSASTRAHRSTVQSSVPDMAAFLQETLGQKLTAYIADVNDPRTVSRWSKGERQPRSESEARIVAAFQTFQLLLTEEAPQTVRAWFLGLNPQLGDESPAAALREGKFRDTLTAAKAFLSGG